MINDMQNLTPNPIGNTPTEPDNLLAYRRDRADEIRLANRTCIDKSDLGLLYAEGLTLLEPPVRCLVQIPPTGMGDDRRKVLTTCCAAVYDLALAGFDVIEQGHLTVLPGILREIEEWSILMLAAISDDSIAPKLLNDKVSWNDVLTAAKGAWPAQIEALLEDWGKLSGLVHNQKTISVAKYWPEGMDKPQMLVGANMVCRRTITFLIMLCLGIGNFLLILRKWDGLQGLANNEDGANTDDTWRDSIDEWRTKFEDPENLVADSLHE